MIPPVQSWHWQRWGLAGALFLSSGIARPQGADSAFAQIERRVAAGDRAGAHLLADSLLTVVPRASMSYAEALYWRAFSAANAAEAERDYLQLSIEYPLSPRSAPASLNLALLEYARHDHAAARRHFDQVLREHPTGQLVGKASYWSARLAFDDGDSSRACELLTTSRRTAPGSDVELLNQIDYYTARCVAMASADSAARSDSARAIAVRDSTRAAEAAKKEFCVQVASYVRRTDASLLAAQLRRRGYESRVVGVATPFRVRVGRYPSRDAARTALVRLQRGNPRAIIVEAEPR